VKAALRSSLPALFGLCNMAAAGYDFGTGCHRS
jgi:hypothetical protein